MEATNQANYNTQENEVDNGFLNLQFFIKSFILNWQWIALSVFICLCLAVLYVRYTSPVYQVGAKVLIKDNDNKDSRSSIKAAANLGYMSTTDGLYNELEIMKSKSIFEGVVRDLKLYVNYKVEGRIKDRAIYKGTPVFVDLDAAHLDSLVGILSLDVSKRGNTYMVEGQCEFNGPDNAVPFRASGSLPMTIKTKAGTVTVVKNAESHYKWDKNRSLNVCILNPKNAAVVYSGAFGASALSKSTTIANLTYNDIIPERGIDLLKQLVVVYNRFANIDKNEMAIRTEEFINDRLLKISNELGSTEGQIKDYKMHNSLVDVAANAGLATNNADQIDKQLTEVETQLLLLEGLKELVYSSSNKYQVMPSNIGLTDQGATSLISQYNNIVLNRNQLLTSASELSPNVVALTAQLDELTVSIKHAVDLAIKNTKIQKSSLLASYKKYSTQVTNSPEQERYLTDISRQQQVKSSLYIMLLAKREENSIALAATADKGKLIDAPVLMSKVYPKNSMIYLIAFLCGFGIPFVILIVREMMRFRVESHEDIAQFTDKPIICDIPVANELAKTKGEIVIRENRNGYMEEIFRGMRTNLQFMLKDNQNVIMFTSTVSGEGKTFVAANLAVSFALLGKKVLLVGLDIRRPRLATLFELEDDKRGISTLLTHDNPSLEDIKSQIISSGINKNLDILMAGPVPPNPAELVSRPSLDHIFTMLREEYDYVVVDTAPVGLVSDTLQIGRITDVTVCVCRADYTEKSALAELHSIAEGAKLPNMCIAFNGIDMSNRKYGYAYGYGRYGKYSKYGRYGKYGKYGRYSDGYGYGYGYHSYGYTSYHSSHYGNPNDDSIKQ